MKVILESFPQKMDLIRKSGSGRFRMNLNILRVRSSPRKDRFPAIVRNLLNIALQRRGEIENENAVAFRWEFRPYGIGRW